MNWKFAEHTAFLDNVGFKDNDIEKFGQDPVRSLVREALQNSCDAFDEKPGQKYVHVKIRTRKIPKHLLPGFSDIESHIRSCYDIENDPSENLEIKRHIKAFEPDMYSVLEISDYNTTGMNQKSFESLTQGIFKSTKNSLASQGSKGVGKAAFYAASYLRTLLVSSKSDDGFRFRAVAKLSNHKDPNNPFRRLNYKGFYGSLNSISASEVPAQFQRSANGTSVFVIGLWNDIINDDDIIREVLRNYWFAIYGNILVVEVNGKPLHSMNLRENLRQYFPDLRDYNTGEKQNPRPYYETVTLGKHYSRKIYKLGDCSLWLHDNELFNLGSVARFRRTRMLIYKIKDLDPGFAGVFLCDTEEGNRFLKEIENDAHDSWNERINQSYKEDARRVLKEINDFILESYRQFSGNAQKSSFSIDTLDDLFNFSSINALRRERKATSKPKSEPSDSPQDRLLESVQFKSFYENGNIYYKVLIKSRYASRSQKLKISIGTDSSNEAINILYSSHGRAEDDVLTINLDQGLNIIDKLKLDAPFIVAPIFTSVKH